MKNWNQVKLVPEFNEQGVACYKLAGGNYVNEYYVVSEAAVSYTHLVDGNRGTVRSDCDGRDV